MKDMPHQLDTVLSELAELQARATQSLRAVVSAGGKIDPEALERHFDNGRYAAAIAAE